MKVLLVATVQSHICQFHKPLVKMLHEHKAEVHVAARDNLAEKNGMALDFVEKVYNVPFARSPKSKDNIRAYKQLKKLIEDGNYDVVHCNTPMGGIIARLAAHRSRKKGTKVYYTAHGFHFYKGASWKNWAVFYPVERWFAKHRTDKLLTITEEDYQLASKKFRTEIRHTYGVGANSSKYFPLAEDVRKELRREYGYAEDTPLVLCIGELNKNKNQATAIRTLVEIRKTVPSCRLLLAGNGPSEQQLRDLAASLNVADAVDFLGYTLELDKYINISDLTISLSFREGLPFNIMEAMLCRKPVVASENRGHRELIENGVNGVLVSPTDAEEIAARVISLLEDKNRVCALTDEAARRIEKYTDVSVVKTLEQIYF